MASNVVLRDANGQAVTTKTTEVDSVHTPHNVMVGADAGGVLRPVLVDTAGRPILGADTTYGRVEAGEASGAIPADQPWFDFRSSPNIGGGTALGLDGFKPTAGSPWAGVRHVHLLTADNGYRGVMLAMRNLLLADGGGGVSLTVTVYGHLAPGANPEHAVTLASETVAASGSRMFVPLASAPAADPNARAVPGLAGGFMWYRVKIEAAVPATSGSLRLGALAIR